MILLMLDTECVNMLKAIKKNVDIFVNGAKQADDITCLQFRLK